MDYDGSDSRIPAGGYTQPQNGEVDLDESTGEFAYMPNVGVVRTDTFTYWVTDGHDISRPTTVAIDVPVAASARFAYAFDEGRLHIPDLPPPPDWDSFAKGG